MATKNYMINDKWLDLDKQNIVELQSVDGELDSLKVNGSEIVTPSGKITITENGTDIDIAQYALADVNVEGGEVSWLTVFNDSVTTEEFPGGNVADIGILLTANVLRVTLGVTEYICRAYKQGVFVFYGGYGEEDPMEPDFSEYPFEIVMSADEQVILIQTGGTYTLKIEEPTV